MNRKMVTIEELLKIKHFSENVKLASVGVALDKKPITHVTIMEAPDLHEWVTGGEFVFTTWYALSLHPELQEEAIGKLFEKISALGIKTNRFIEKIPGIVLKLAQEHEVVVFEVRTNVKFRELVTTINSQIQNYQTNMLLEIEEYYYRLVNYGMNKNALASIVQELANEVKDTCVYVNYNYEIVASCFKGNAIRDDCSIWQEELRKMSFSRAKSIGERRIKNLHLFECYAREKLIGFLIIVRDNDLDEKEKIIIQQTASFLSMHMWNDYYAKQERVHRVWNSIVTGEVTSAEEISTKIALLGINVDQNFFISIFLKNSQFNDWFQYLNGHFNSKLLVENDEYVVMLCGQQDFEYPFSLLRKDFREYAESNVVVVTDAFAELKQMKMQFDLAFDTFILLKSMNGFGIHRVQDWLSCILLLQTQGCAEYNMVVSSILQPLVQYDNKFKTELLKTLEVAVNSGSLEETAKNLFIHINTLRYRLKKIQEITAKNYFKFNDRYLLFAAIVLYKCSGNSKKM